MSGFEYGKRCDECQSFWFLQQDRNKHSCLHHSIGYRHMKIFTGLEKEHCEIGIYTCSLNHKPEIIHQSGIMRQIPPSGKAQTLIR